MSPRQNNHRGGDDDDDKVPSWLRWVHGGTTVTIAIFIFQQYEVAQDTRRLVQTQIAVLQEQIIELRAANVAQDASHTLALSGIARRLDVQRDDMRILQQRASEHESEDRRTYKRRGE